MSTDFHSHHLTRFGQFALKGPNWLWALALRLNLATTGRHPKECA